MRILAAAAAFPGRVAMAMLALTIFVYGYPATIAYAETPSGLAAPTPAALADTSPLLQRYLQAVTARLAEIPADRLADVPYAAALPDAQLAAWATEYADDWRYWELRYMCAALRPEGAELEPGYRVPADFLREAQRRGSVAGATCLLLYNETRKEHNTAVEPARVEPGPDGLSWMQHMEHEEQALLDQAVELAPDYAWAYYMRAYFWAELGEMELAVADLSAGNAAPVLAYPECWPLSLALAQAAGDPAAATPAMGAVLLLGEQWNRVNWTRMREPLFNLNICMSLDGDLSLIEPWHQFACRFYTSAPYQPGALLSAVAMENTLKAYIEEYCSDELSPEQTTTLLHMRGALAEGMENTRDLYGMPTDSMPALGSPDQTPAEREALRGVWNVRHELECGREMPAIFADLAQAHYPALNMPECLKQYPPMTAADGTSYRAYRALMRTAHGWHK